MNFIDSTKISASHNRRIGSHKVMAAFAARGKISVDWFYGFKLHLIINDQEELLSVKITAGNVDDRDPAPELARSLFGRLFGDRGYISQPLLLFTLLLRIRIRCFAVNLFPEFQSLTVMVSRLVLGDYLATEEQGDPS
ncbi:Transposase DDE domain-containing protein [Nitrosomonas sp. Nm58]|nr:Transposase DDE domain-containing protein [Nitrosomonas sp. Nm58]